MEILLIAIISLIVLGHTGSAIFGGIPSRVLTYITILLHPTALIPMLLLDLPFEAVALLFMSSALYYLFVTVLVSYIKKSHTPSNIGGDES